MYKSKKKISKSVLQHFITTVCVAGKMFQGVPCASIELAVESAARNALMVFISILIAV